MCWCAEPTRETDPGRAPALAEGDTLLYDEPGRCQPMVNGKGKTDYHSHHLRLVGTRHGGYALLVRHGGGDERIDLGGQWTRVGELFGLLPDSDARYLMLYALLRAHEDAGRAAGERERGRWKRAAREGRIRTRKRRGADEVRVWIEDAPRVPLTR